MSNSSQPTPGSADLYRTTASGNGKKIEAILGILFGLFLIWIISLVGKFLTEDIRPALWSAPHWPTTVGLRVDEPNTDIPKYYKYEWEGRPYRGSTVWIVGEPDGSYEDRAGYRKMFANITSVEPLVVYVNPDDPSDSCLVPRPFKTFRGGTMLSVGLLASLIFVGLGVLMANVRKLRASLLYQSDSSKSLPSSWASCGISEDYQALQRKDANRLRIPVFFAVAGLCLSVVGLAEKSLGIVLSIPLIFILCFGIGFAILAFLDRVFCREIWQFDKESKVLQFEGKQIHLSEIEKVEYNENIEQTEAGKSIPCKITIGGSQGTLIDVPVGFLSQKAALSLAKRLAHLLGRDLETDLLTAEKRKVEKLPSNWEYAKELQREKPSKFWGMGCFMWAWSTGFIGMGMLGSLIWYLSGDPRPDKHGASLPGIENPWIPPIFFILVGLAFMWVIVLTCAKQADPRYRDVGN